MTTTSHPQHLSHFNACAACMDKIRAATIECESRQLAGLSDCHSHQVALPTNPIFTLVGNDDRPIALVPFDIARQVYLLALVTEDRTDEEHAALMQVGAWLDRHDGNEVDPVIHVADTNYTRAAHYSRSTPDGRFTDPEGT